MAEMAQALPWGQDEAEFLTELQAGSETAFDWLVTHYHAPVYNLVHGMLGDSADSADVTQEVFIKAFRAIKGFRHGSSLKTWLYRIAVRQALNQRRWWWRHLRLQTSIDVDESEDHRPLELESHEASPFERLASHEVQQVVRSALAKVSEPFRAAVILRDLEGLAYEEVAEVLEVSVGTVKSRILRGRRALKDILEPLLNGKERSQPAQSKIERNSQAADSFSMNMMKTTHARAAQKPRWELRRTELRGGGE
ncbi:MAG: sigma-70 family RNA polymerase sigma factor [Acidobacteria bacterium]|nr:sigma-70 family RNA polymerase sigma factor [Acidobacteriota bacterium]